MIDEKHRQLSIETFDQYASDLLNTKSYSLKSFKNGDYIPIPEWMNCIYVLRIGDNALKGGSLSSIAARLDPKGILYIGGHESKRITGRFNNLLKSAHDAEGFYKEHGYAKNEAMGGHSVGGCLTTSILNEGFSIDDCIIDLVESGHTYDELELLIGYQEKFHHLPPWNTLRGGASAYHKGS